MPNTDNLEPSDNVEDRRGAVPMSDAEADRRKFIAKSRDTFNPSNAWDKIKGMAGMKGPGAPEGSLGDQAGMNNFAEGGTVPDDQYDEDEIQTTMGAGAIPTMEDSGSEYDQNQFNQSPAVPNVAQSGGGANDELTSLVRAVHSYGMRMASGGQSSNQAQSFADGGMVDSSDDAEQVLQQDQSQPQQVQQQPQQQNGFLKFIQGDRAMDPQTMAAIEHTVDPDGSMPGASRKAQMIQYAYQKGLQQTNDPRQAMDMALGVLQHQRKQFDMWRTAAAVKLNQGDVGSSIDAANKAFEAPFGHNVKFAPIGGGVRSYGDGGSTDEEDQDQTQPAYAPGYAQAGPFIPQEDALNTREKALDKSGLGGAFGQAQHQQISNSRQQLAEEGPAIPTSSNGPLMQGVRRLLAGKPIMGDGDVSDEEIPGWGQRLLKGEAIAGDISPPDGGRNDILNTVKGAIKGAVDNGLATPARSWQNIKSLFATGKPAVTATVTDDQGTPIKTIPLSKDDFAKSLMNGSMSFDHFIQQGVPDTLSGGVQQQVQPQPQGRSQDPWGDDARWQKREQRLRAQANKIFPMVSQGQRAEAWIANQLNGERMAYMKSQVPIQRIQYVQEHQDERAAANREASGERNTARIQAGNDRLSIRENAINERFDKGWERRAQAALDKQNAQNRTDPNSARKTAIVHSLLQQYNGDPEGFKKGLADYGLDANRDIFGTGGGNAGQGGGQPQRAPQATGGNTQASQKDQGGTWIWGRNKAGELVQRNDLTGEVRRAQQ